MNLPPAVTAPERTTTTSVILRVGVIGFQPRDLRFSLPAVRNSACGSSRRRIRRDALITISPDLPNLALGEANPGSARNFWIGRRLMKESRGHPLLVSSSSVGTSRLSLLSLGRIHDARVIFVQ